MTSILIAEDEEDIRRELGEILEAQGYKVFTAANGALALQVLQEQAVQLVLTDLRMPKVDGLELMRKARAGNPETAFIMMTAFGSLETAVEAMRAGAADYLIKPVAIEELLTKVNRIVENTELRAANRLLKRDLDRKLGPMEMIGQSPRLEEIRALVRKVAPARSPVLITGESGTGKELIARALHALGANKGEPFVPVNCAAIPENLLESELFGHQKGAFTGAIADSEGLFRAARKGTLFLDEVGELPLAMQAKLLRALEEKQVHPVGSSRYVPFEARVVSATNRDMKKEIEEKRFREDLFYRLAVVELHSPPLRQRSEDIPLLVQHLLKRFNGELGRAFQGVEENAIAHLVALPWKGNIRELQNMLERAMLVGTEPKLTLADFSPGSLHSGTTVIETPNLKDAVGQFEKAHVQRMLRQCKDDKRKAAAELGISLSSMYRYLGDTKNLAQDKEE